MTTTAKLVAMFEADRTDPDYFERFPMYKYVHSEAGGRPWWPPLEQVWQRQGKPMDYDDAAMVAEVWAILSDLHADYLAAVDQ